MAYHFIPQKLRILFFHTETVVFPVTTPVLQLDHQINRLRILDVLNTVERLHIDDPYAAELDKMARQIRSRADQRGVRHFPQNHHVIAHETVASSYEFKGSLALSDPALSHDEHAFAVYIHQHSMYRNARSQLHAEPADDFRHKSARCAFRHQRRDAILPGYAQHVHGRLCQSRKNDTGYPA